MKTLKVHFPSLNETFTMEPIMSPSSCEMWWVVEEEQERWYHRSGTNHSTMQVKDGKVRFIYNGGERHGRVVE